MIWCILLKNFYFLIFYYYITILILDRQYFLSLLWILLLIFLLFVNQPLDCFVVNFLKLTWTSLTRLTIRHKRVLFYLFPILIALNRLVHSWVSVFFSFLFYCNSVLIPTNSSLLRLLKAWYLNVFSQFLQKLQYSLTWKKNVRNILLVFFLRSVLHPWMVLTNFLIESNDCVHFFSTNLWYSAFFVYNIFFFIMQVECNLSEGYVIKKLSFITIFIVVFYKIFTKLRCIFSPLKTVCMQLLSHFLTFPIHVNYLWSHN